ncbi:MAG: hypothetical protein R2882_08670 [Gemmatimonadales bacterium]
MIELTQLTEADTASSPRWTRSRSRFPRTLYGLLGPNGSKQDDHDADDRGDLRPTSGTVSVAGYDVVKQPMEAKQRLGFIPDRPFVYDKLTGAEFLRFVAGLYGQSGPISTTGSTNSSSCSSWRPGSTS